MHSGCLFQKCHHSAQRWLLPGLASNKKRPYHTGFIMLGCMTVNLSVNAVVKLFPWNLVWGKKAESPIWEVKSSDAIEKISQHFGKGWVWGRQKVQAQSTHHIGKYGTSIRVRVLSIWKVTKMAPSLSMDLCAYIRVPHATPHFASPVRQLKTKWAMASSHIAAGNPAAVDSTTHHLDFMCQGQQLCCFEKAALYL